MIALAARSYVDNHCKVVGRLRAAEKLVKCIKYFTNTGKVSTTEHGPLFFIFYLKDPTNTPIPSNEKLALKYVRDLTLWNPCEDMEQWTEMLENYRVDVNEALLNTALAIRKSIAGIEKRRISEAAKVD
jgi:hypothetical protein